MTFDGLYTTLPPMSADELRAWRLRHHYSQQRLADALGVHSLTISKWERQDRGIPTYLSLALETLVNRRATS